MFFFQLDCSPILPTEPQLRLEAAKSTTGKLIVVVVHVHVPQTIISIGNEAISQLLVAPFLPNFKGRFLGLFEHIPTVTMTFVKILTKKKAKKFHHYRPDFDQTLKVGSSDHLEQLKLSQWHLSSQHLSWRHLSISGISQLLLTRFWPNFKGRFLGQSRVS